jgi:hypothetical protein
VSLAGRAATKGSTLSLYRPTYGAAAAGDGTRQVTSWTLLTSGLRGVLDVLTADLADKVFGQMDVARTRTLLPPGTDVVAGDALVVTAGFQLGARFRVTAVQRYDFRARSAHADVALESTTEAIP